MAQNEMKAKPALPERVRSMEGLGRTALHDLELVALWIADRSECATPELEFRRSGEHHSLCQEVLVGYVHTRH